MHIHQVLFLPAFEKKNLSSYDITKMLRSNLKYNFYIIIHNRCRRSKVWNVQIAQFITFPQTFFINKINIAKVGVASEPTAAFYIGLTKTWPQDGKTASRPQVDSDVN